MTPHCVIPYLPLDRRAGKSPPTLVCWRFGMGSEVRRSGGELQYIHSGLTRTLSYKMIRMMELGAARVGPDHPCEPCGATVSAF